MNKKGQSLIVFVLILPLIILCLAFFIDSSLSILKKNKIKGIIESNMQMALDNNIRDIEKIEKAIKKNDDILVNVSISDDDLYIKASNTSKSLFAKILNFSWYKLEYDYSGNYVNKRINKK